MALIFDIKHFAIHDGDGIRTTIFFKGCPLKCRWCHNPEGIKFGVETFYSERIFDGKQIISKKTVGREVSSDELIVEILKDRIFYNHSIQGGVTISGGEPISQTDALLDLLSKCKIHGLHTAIDTSGYADSSDFKRVLESENIDLMLFDIKVIDKKLHKEATGVDNDLILKNLEQLKRSNIRTIIRLPMIPTISFTKQNISQLIEFLKGVKCSNITEISLLPYHNNAKGKCAQFKYNYLMPDDIKPLEHNDLIEAKQLLQTNGWKVSIG